MSEFINDLIEQGKLELAVDKEKNLLGNLIKLQVPAQLRG